MNRMSVKRAAAGLATLAISGMSLVAMAPPASAVVAGTISSASAPTVLNTTNQSAGDLVIDVVAAAVNGDTHRHPRRSHHGRLRHGRRGRQRHQVRLRGRRQPQRHPEPGR